MDDALTVHRLQFAFTITYHYLFPQLTMGLALLLVVFRWLDLRRPARGYDDITRFLTRIFAINFGFGVVTGIPMEFQFGTNWASFSRGAGSIVGQTLAMEGVFAFFLESAFLGVLLYGEKRVSPRGMFFVSVMLFVGTWLSGFFIIVTNAWMQHPVGHRFLEDGSLSVDSLAVVLTNEWAWWQYAHTMCGSLVTATFVVAGIGAFYLLSGRFVDPAQAMLRVAVPMGLAASTLMAFPTGDAQGKLVAEHQPATLAAMEGLFTTREGAPLVLIGQPDMERRRLDNAIEIPRLLSFLTYQRWKAEVRGLDEFPEETWPTNIPLLYYGYHVMVGLGTMFIGVMGLAAFLLWRRRLFSTRAALWAVMLMAPFPYIANTAGWMTAELGRQPWLIYGIMRTAEGVSSNVSAGNALFTLIGFMGLYALLSILFILLISRELSHGPAPQAAH